MPLDWTRINQDALNSVDLDGLVSHAGRFDCTTFGSEVSRVEREEGRWSPDQRECLRFIGAVLMMMLRPDEPDEPYGPIIVMDGRRSPIPADFDKQGLLGIEAWALSLRDPELRARFLDVLWVQARSFPAAKGAVEAYIASALRLEHHQKWTSGHKRVERALRLAAGLGKGGADLRQSVLAEAEAMLHRHRGTDPLYLTMRLIRLLLEFKHGDAKQFSEYAMVAATTAEAAQDFWRAKDYYQLVAECRRAAGDTDGEAVALRCSAECLVKEAGCCRGDAPSARRARARSGIARPTDSPAEGLSSRTKGLLNPHGCLGASSARAERGSGQATQGGCIRSMYDGATAFDRKA